MFTRASKLVTNWQKKRLANHIPTKSFCTGAPALWCLLDGSFSLYTCWVCRVFGLEGLEELGTLKAKLKEQTMAAEEAMAQVCLMGCPVACSEHAE